MTALAQFLARLPLIAILPGITPDESERIGDALVRAGFAIIEVPLNSPQPLDSIRRLCASLGDDILIGAGTVTTAAQVSDVASVGGRLIVMPHLDPEVVRTAVGAHKYRCQRIIAHLRARFFAGGRNSLIGIVYH